MIPRLRIESVPASVLIPPSNCMFTSDTAKLGLRTWDKEYTVTFKFSFPSILCHSYLQPTSWRQSCWRAASWWGRRRLRTQSPACSGAQSSSQDLHFASSHHHYIRRSSGSVENGNWLATCELQLYADPDSRLEPEVRSMELFQLLVSNHLQVSTQQCCMKYISKSV